ncbi:MAG: hypothetical protein AAF488_04550, partial [Planctomycetota bacterium]
MSFPRWILPTLVLGVGLTLVGALGSGVITRDRDARSEAAVDARRHLAERWADQRSAAYQAQATSVRRGRAESVRRYRHDVILGLLPDQERATVPTEAERARFERSRRGGDAYLSRGERGRAIDAYSFAVPTLSDPGLSDRLLLRVGRVSLERAAADESSDDLDRTVGMRILQDLAQRPSTAVEGVMPVEFLARIALAAHGHPEALPTREELVDRFDTLPLAVVEALARRKPSTAGDALSEKLASARTLDRAVRHQRERLREGRTQLVPDGERNRVVVPLSNDDGSIIVAVADAPGDESEREAIRVAGYAPELIVSGDRSPVTAEGENESHAAVKLDGEPVAIVSVTDPNYSATLVEIARREASLRVALYAVLLVVGVALLATWLAIDRQRRLAELKVRLLANVS